MSTLYPFDKQIVGAIAKLAATEPYFKRPEVEKIVRGQRKSTKIPPHIQEQINDRYFLSRISELLRVRDSFGIRVYENYADGSGERRWMLVRAMGLKHLRSVVQETRVQERDLHIKGEGYEFFVRELEKLGPKARVDDVYDAVAPRIQAYRNKARGAA